MGAVPWKWVEKDEFIGYIFDPNHTGEKYETAF